LIVARIRRRPLPSVSSLLLNRINLNRTALKHLIQFDNDYEQLLNNEQQSIKSYEQEYHEDSLIMKRIMLLTNYDMCRASSNRTNALQSLIELVNEFLRYRLRRFNTKLIDRQVYSLPKRADNHSLVEYLRRTQIEMKMIERILPNDNDFNVTSSSCIIDLLERLLDKRINTNELPGHFHLYLPDHVEHRFISNDWPFLIMIYDRLLRTTSIDTLMNFLVFDAYRQSLYPYYQPHLSRPVDFRLDYIQQSSRYTYTNDFHRQTCHVHTCFDVLNCYHPILLNQLMQQDNQVDDNTYRHVFKDTTEARIRLYVAIDRVHCVNTEST
jgi:hypothetical protein